MDALQMRMPIQAEQADGLLPPRLKEQLHRIGTVSPDRQGVFHRTGQFRQRGIFQKPQHLDELAGAMLLQLGLLAATQHAKAIRQFPIFQRPGVV